MEQAKMPDIKNILTQAVQLLASDVHINVTMPPMLRENTERIAIELTAVRKYDATQKMLRLIGEARLIRF